MTSWGPEVELSDWCIMEVSCEDNAEVFTRHLVGTNLEYDSGRVSSPIEQFDKNALSARTRSGRTYILVGEPGVSIRSAFVWANWCGKNRVITSKDVTQEYYPEFDVAEEPDSE